MKIALVNPGNPSRKPLGAYNRVLEPFAPLGLAYLAAALGRAGHEVFVFDQFSDAIPTAVLADRLRDLNLDLIGASCLTPDVPDIAELRGALRARGVRASLVLGNLHATLFAEKLLADDLCDYVVRGEGEQALPALVERLERGVPLAGLQGVSRAGYHSADLAEAPDIETLPFPAWEKFSLPRYIAPPIFRFERVLLAVQTSRGCPYHCYFCCQNAMVPRVRIRSVTGVADEIERNLKDFAVNFFWFSDSIFPLSKKYGHEVADELIRRGLHRKVRWYTECRVNSLDEELLVHLKQAGLIMTIYGFEAGDQDVLARIKPGVTLEHARAVMKMTKKVGLASLGLFIIGLPGETEQTIRRTIDFSLELDPDYAKFNRAVPYPGTPFYDEYKDRIRHADDYRLYNPWTTAPNAEPLFVPEGISYPRLVALQKLAMRKFYLRPAKALRLILSRRISLRHGLRGVAALVEGLLAKAR